MTFCFSYHTISFSAFSPPFPSNTSSLSVFSTLLLYHSLACYCDCFLPSSTPPLHFPVFPLLPLFFSYLPPLGFPNLFCSISSSSSASCSSSCSMSDISCRTQIIQPELYEVSSEVILCLSSYPLVSSPPPFCLLLF